MRKGDSPSFRRSQGLSPFLFAICLLTWCLGGCQPREPTLRIAVALPLTGDIAAMGQGIKRACQLAVEEAQQRNRFPGQRLEIVAFDDRSDPKEAVGVANRIVSDPSVVAVIGHFNSGCSIPAAQVYARAGLPMISPAASNPKLTLQQWEPSWPGPRNVFRVNTTDDVQGAYGAEFTIKRLKVRRVSILHDKTAYGQGIAEEFRKRLESLGGTVLSFDGITVADKDFSAVLTRIGALKPEAIYFGGDYSGGGLLVRQARERGIQVVFVMSEANRDIEFLRVAGASAEGCYITFLGSPPELLPSAQNFIKAYQARYPHDSVRPYDHYGYEATQILLSALETAGPDRARLVDALRTTRYQGVLGETRFDEKGDTLNHTITLFQVTNGQFVPLPS